MRLFLACFGAYLMLVGALLALQPPLGKRLTDWWLKDKVRRPWALLPGILGAVLLWWANRSHAPRLFTLLGVLGLVKAAYLLVAPKAQLRRLLTWWGHRPMLFYRFWGLIAVIMGVVVFCAR